MPASIGGMQSSSCPPVEHAAPMLRARSRIPQTHHETTSSTNQDHLRQAAAPEQQFPSLYCTAQAAARRPGPSEEPRQHPRQIPRSVSRDKHDQDVDLLSQDFQRACAPATGMASQSCSSTWQRCRSTGGSSCGER